MIKKDLEIFFERILTEPEFREEFTKASTAEAGYKLAKEYIPDVSFDEFKDGLITIHKRFVNKSYKPLNREDALKGKRLARENVEEAPKSNRESVLNDSDLDNVSGGKINQIYNDVVDFLRQI